MPRAGRSPPHFLRGLLAEVFAANIGGTATLIGDPPNIMIGSRTGLTFNQFLYNLAPITVLLLIVFIGLCKLMFGRLLRVEVERFDRIAELNERDSITDERLLQRSLLVLAAVVLGFVVHHPLGISPAVVALFGAGLMVVVSGATTEEFFEEVEWDTLVFFVGLFVLVGGLVQVGVIERLGTIAVDAVGDEYFLASVGLLVGPAVIGGLIDTIPFVATIIPVVENLVATVPDPRFGEALWWSLALGGDLGGNATAIGASANVVAWRRDTAGRSRSGSARSTA